MSFPEVSYADTRTFCQRRALLAEESNTCRFAGRHLLA